MQTVFLQALGTHWNIDLLDSGIDIDNIQQKTQDFLECFEGRYSRFRPDSWISILNREKVFNNPHHELVNLLRESLRYYESTQGVFNVGVGEKMEYSGYDSEYSFVKKGNNSIDIPVLTDVLEVTQKKITLQEGKIDLGGIGKGFVIDSLAEYYKDELGLESFIINGGGDIYATHDNGEPISVILSHPRNAELSIGTVMLRNQGFAASSPFVRTWTDKNTQEKYNHLHTNNEVTSYVVGDTACAADVWATTYAIEPLQIHKGVQRLLLKDLEIIYTDSIFKLNAPD